MSEEPRSEPMEEATPKSAEDWLDDNHEAVAAHNERVCTKGSWLVPRWSR